MIIPRIAGCLPLDASIKILNPIIATDIYPSNLCAVKLLKELVETQGNEFTDEHLDSVMQHLVRVGLLFFLLSCEIILNHVFYCSCVMTASLWSERRRCSVLSNYTWLWEKIK